MLELRALCMGRGSLRWQHDFKLERGQIMALMGPSGAGKSTLLECLGGFVPPLAGEILLDGRSLQDVRAEDRPVATLFQQHNLFEHISVAHNLRLGFNQGRPSTIQWQRVEAACEHLGVASLLGRLPGELSGGQRQRIGLIRTVLREQPLILLDEPFGALDAEARVVAGDWVRAEIDHGTKMLIFVTHEIDDAQRWANQTLVIGLP
ncbi:MAG: ATP-binding cassette domain-containing protein [Zoogloeaceae bacterium]|nr:ATP-binding cassette domain-containing protein [Zoogloeaceae bacterium]